MTHYPFFLIDAFTNNPLSGNACAVIFDADDLTEEKMQAIARETNQAETAFVSLSKIADIKVRYFTPANEIPLAGHPTIATAYALVISDRLSIRDGCTSITFELQVGRIQVEISNENGKVKRITMTQLKPKFLRSYSSSEIMSIFNLGSEDVLPNVPIQTVSTGTPQLMVPLRSMEAIKRAQLDISAFINTRRMADFSSCHLFCLEGITPEGDTFARHFDAPPDLIEDPFTGSATGSMGSYAWKYNLIKSQKFIAEQGHLMQRPGRAHVEVIGPRDNIQSVKVGGEAIETIRGTLKF